MISIVLLKMVLAFGRSAQADPGTFLGYSYPAPMGLSGSPLCQSTATQLGSELRSILETGKSRYGSFTPNATSVSMKLSSALDDTSCFDFSFTSKALDTSNGGVSTVDDISIFRIGSVSKLFTVYAFLLNDGMNYWDSPITQFVPELRAAPQYPLSNAVTDSVQWQDVTLGSLCSQLSGIGRDCMFRDFLLVSYFANRSAMQTRKPIFLVSTFRGWNMDFQNLTHPRFRNVEATNLSHLAREPVCHLRNLCTGII